MKISKKLMLGLLIASSVNISVFAMEAGSPGDDQREFPGEKRSRDDRNDIDEDNRKAKKPRVDYLTQQPDEIILQICNELISDLNVNNYEQLYEAVKRLCRLRKTCKRFNNLLTDENIAKILEAKGLNVNIQDENKDTLLHQAIIFYGYPSKSKILKILIESLPIDKKADALLAKGSRDWNLFTLCAHLGDIETSRMLFKYANELRIELPEYELYRLRGYAFKFEIPYVFYLETGIPPLELLRGLPQAILEELRSIFRQ